MAKAKLMLERWKTIGN